MGHFAMEKMLKKMSENYWFGGMRKFVKKYVAACLNCLYYKHPSGKKQGMLHPIVKVPVPFHTLHADHLGPFETSKKGNRYLLVIVDSFTKFTIIEPVRDTKTNYVTQAMMNIFYLFGVPSRIITDRGTAFTSKTFGMFCSSYGLKHILNAVSTPRANGQCERYNRTILSALATSAAGTSECLWDTFVKKVQSAMNCTFNKSIGVSPIEALAGYKPRHMADSRILNSVTNDLGQVDLEELRDKISERIAKDQKSQKERFDKLRASAIKYDEGQLVMVAAIPLSTGGSRKLLPRFKGPFRVTKVLLNDRYEVKDLREGAKKTTTVVAVDKMKPWVVLGGKVVNR